MTISTKIRALALCLVTVFVAASAMPARAAELPTTPGPIDDAVAVDDTVATDGKALASPREEGLSLHDPVVIGIVTGVGAALAPAAAVAPIVAVTLLTSNTQLSPIAPYAPLMMMAAVPLSAVVAAGAVGTGMGGWKSGTVAALAVPMGQVTGFVAGGAAGWVLSIATLYGSVLTGVPQLLFKDVPDPYGLLPVALVGLGTMAGAMTGTAVGGGITAGLGAALFTEPAAAE